MMRKQWYSVDGDKVKININRAPETPQSSLACQYLYNNHVLDYNSVTPCSSHSIKNLKIELFQNMWN
jgi:hypothetical protein